MNPASFAPADPYGALLRMLVPTTIGRKDGEMSEKLTIGTPAPDFTLPADGGRSISLSKLAGKKVVLYFYPKDDTSGCTKEAIAFNGLRAGFRQSGNRDLRRVPDSAASHDKFKKKYDLDFPLAADEEKAMLDAYGVWVEKSMYGKKYMGVERTTV